MGEFTPKLLVPNKTRVSEENNGIIINSISKYFQIVR